MLLGVDFLYTLIYNGCIESEVRTISPRTGRPPKEIIKSERMQIRLTKETAEKLQRCATQMDVSRSEVVEYGIDLVAAELQKKK